eukprot:1148970-Pelagomonas_calceolata.AAC.2
MSRKSTLTYRAGVGSHRPYVCAYDSSGGKACSESSFVLREPPNGYTPQQLVSTLKAINFRALLGTGDDNSVWEAAQDVISHLSAVSFELNQEDEAFVDSLLEDASEAVSSISSSEYPSRVRICAWLQVADAGVGVSAINTENSLSHQGRQDLVEKWEQHYIVHQGKCTSIQRRLLHKLLCSNINAHMQQWASSCFLFSVLYTKQAAWLGLGKDLANWHRQSKTLLQPILSLFSETFDTLYPPLCIIYSLIPVA